MEDDDIFLEQFEFAKKQVKHFSISPEDVVADEQEDKKQILEPNHPLLGKFQKTLKDYLNKEILRLREEVLELETGAKKKNADREQIGIEAYEAQQIVTMQQNQIDRCQKELEEVTAATEEVEEQLKKSNEELKVAQKELVKAEKEEIDLRNEVEATNLLFAQMSKWEQDIESELLINQRISEKTRKEKIMIANEKKQQDAFIYRLMNEVWKLENELETVIMQLRVNEDLREKYAEAIMLANIEIESAQAEQKNLVYSWQTLIHNISKRDGHYNEVLQLRKVQEEKLIAIDVEMNQVRRMINKEHMINETLTVFIEKLDYDRKLTNKQINVEVEKKRVLEKKILEYMAIIEQNERDLAIVKADIVQIQPRYIEYKSITDKLAAEKTQYEEMIIEYLHTNMITDRSSSSKLRFIKGQKEKRRELHIQLSKIENNNVRVATDIRYQQLENDKLKSQLFDLQKEIGIRDAVLAEATKDLDTCKDDQVKSLYNYQKLMRKLLKMEEEIDTEVNPHETRIKMLEGLIQDTIEKNKESQTFWLRDQTIIVDLTEKRQAQIRDLNLLSKQITILDQKNLKINDEIEKYLNTEDSLIRNISALQNKLSSSTDMLDNLRGKKETLDERNNLSQVELALKLEDSEFESLKLKAEICEIEEDKLSLSNELIEKNREFLCWEKKIKLAIDCKKSIRQEQSDDGEIGKMKSEIHRMNVRYSQLKKAQDKLMHDMENTISRRESILVVAEARMKLMGGGFQKLRVNYTKKMDDFKNKLKQIDDEEEKVNQRIEMKEYEIKNVEEEISEAEKDCKEIQEECVRKSAEIEQWKIDKQLNLDILLYKQRKMKVYIELARGHTPYCVYKTQLAANIAYEREKTINSKLRVIVENLMSDFPQHVNFFTKLHNSLVVPAINI